MSRRNWFWLFGLITMVSVAVPVAVLVGPKRSLMVGTVVAIPAWWMVKNRAPGAAEYEIQTRWTILTGVSLFLIGVLFFSSSPDVLPATVFGILFTILAVLIFVIPYQTGLICWIMTAVTAGLMSLPLPTTMNATATVGILLGAYMVTALGRLNEGIFDDYSIVPGEFVGYSALYGLVLIGPVVVLIPLVELGVAELAIFETLGWEQQVVSPGEQQIGKLFTELAIRLMGMSVGLILVLWFLKRFLPDVDPDEIPEVAPETQQMSVRRERSVQTGASYQPLVRGGVAGKLLQLVHRFVQDYASTQFEKQTGETIRQYINRLVRELEADEKLARAGWDYDQVRYGQADPDQDDVERVRNQLDTLRKLLSS